MNEQDNDVLGRLRPLLSKCQADCCPCSPGVCELVTAITHLEIAHGEVSDYLYRLRGDAFERKLPSAEHHVGLERH